MNRKQLKKTASGLAGAVLSACICFSVLPSAAAQISPPDDIIAEELKTDTSGTCGQNANWNLSGGTLTVSGSGNMVNWELVSNVPWYKQMGEIRNVVICEGITNVGRAAFLGASNLSSVTISSTVNSISSNAFEKSGLQSVVLPSSVRSLGKNAFAGCYNLREIKIYCPTCDIVGTGETISNGGGGFGGTIFGGAGSTAQNFANKYGYHFSVLADVTTTAKPTTTTTIITTTSATQPKPPQTSAPPTKPTTASTTKATTTTTTTTTTTWNWWQWQWPQQPQPTTQAPPVLYGDANLDREVNIADAVIIMQSISNPNAYGINGWAQSHITSNGQDAGDVHQRGNGITNADALTIQKYKLDIISSLPSSE